MDSIMKKLECPVCMEIYNEPKLLKCLHTFCKECVENMLIFNGDESADIECPICKRISHINADETTENLNRNYALQDVLSSVPRSSGSEHLIRCAAVDSDVNGCGKEAARWCWHCNLFLCSSCVHDCNHMHIKEINKQICLCHKIKTTTICKECGTFVCRFCIHRQHKNHEMESVDERAASCREEMKEYNNIHMNIQRLYKTTEDLINRNKETFKIILERRKLMVISNFIEQINEKEADIMSNFDKLADQHMHQQQYLSLDFNKSLKDLEQRSNSEIIAVRGLIDDITLMQSNSLEYQEIQVDLVDTDSYDLTDHFVFNLCNNSKEKFKLEREMINKSTLHFQFGKESKEETSHLKDILNELRTLCDKYSENKVSDDKPIPPEQSPEMSEMLCKYKLIKNEKEKFEFIRTLIREGQVESLKHLLSSVEGLVKIRGVLNRTLLMEAIERKQLPSVNLLMKHGADSNDVDDNGSNAFHYAVRYNIPEVILKLLEYDEAGINCRDRNGYTPLMYAVLWNYISCVESLLSSSRLDISSCNEAIEEARKRRHVAIEEKIKEYIASRKR